MSNGFGMPFSPANSCRNWLDFPGCGLNNFKSDVEDVCGRVFFGGGDLPTWRIVCPVVSP